MIITRNEFLSLFGSIIWANQDFWLFYIVSNIPCSHRCLPHCAPCAHWWRPLWSHAPLPPHALHRYIAITPPPWPPPMLIDMLHALIDTKSCTRTPTMHSVLASSPVLAHATASTVLAPAAHSHAHRAQRLRDPCTDRTVAIAAHAGNLTPSSLSSVRARAVRSLCSHMSEQMKETQQKKRLLPNALAQWLSLRVIHPDKMTKL